MELNVDNIIDNLLEVRSFRPGKTVALKEEDIKVFSHFRQYNP